MKMFRFWFAILMVAGLLCGCAGEETETAPEATRAVNVVGCETLADRLLLEVLWNVDMNRPNYMKKLEEMAQITVTEYSEEQGTIAASVTVVSPDMYAVVKSMENVTYESENSMDTDACFRLDSAASVTWQMRITFRQNGDDWAPELTEEFLDALYGGLMTYRNEYMEV